MPKMSKKYHICFQIHNYFREYETQTGVAGADLRTGSPPREGGREGGDCYPEGRTLYLWSFIC